MAEPEVEVQPEPTPEPEPAKVEQTPEERIRSHNAKLSAEDVDLVRAKLLETTHTFPSGERALTAALADLGLEKREPAK